MLEEVRVELERKREELVQALENLDHQREEIVNTITALDAVLRPPKAKRQNRKEDRELIRDRAVHYLSSGPMSLEQLRSCLVEDPALAHLKDDLTGHRIWGIMRALTTRQEDGSYALHHE